MRVRISTCRRMVQCLAMLPLLGPVHLGGATIWTGNYLSSHLLSVPLTDPLVAAEVTVATRNIVGGLLLSAIPLVLTAAILGRIFCSWVCPLNTVLEAAAYLKKPYERAVRKDSQPFILLGIFLIMSAALSLPLFTILSPIGMITRFFSFGIGAEFIFIGLLVAVEWFYNQKLWCRRICPAGALYALLSRYRLLRIGVSGACNQCNECHRRCSMKVDVGSESPMEIMSCTNCGLCVDVCSTKAVAFHWKTTKKGGTDTDELITSAKG